MTAIRTERLDKLAVQPLRIVEQNPRLDRCSRITEPLALALGQRTKRVLTIEGERRNLVNAKTIGDRQ